MPDTLQHVFSPEELDRPFPLLRPRIWLGLIALAVIVAAGATWTLLGRVPETADGAGVMVHPGGVRPIESPFGGQVVELKVRLGQEIAEGEVVAVVNLPEIAQQLRLAEDQLQELKKQDQFQRRLEENRESGEERLATTKRDLTNDTIKKMTDQLANYDSLNENTIKSRRETLQLIRDQSKTLSKALKERLDNVKDLQQRKLATTDAVVAAEAAFIENEQRMTELELKLVEFDLRGIEARQYSLQQRQKIDELAVQVKSLDVQATQLRQELTRLRTDRELHIRDQEDQVKLLKTRLDDRTTIRSRFRGRILELAVQPGQTLQPGGRLGTIERTDREVVGDLTVLAYFDVREGKRIREGMEALVTPSTVQRERFGSIIGRVKRISPFPVTVQSAAAEIGQPELAQALGQPGGAIAVEIELDRADTASGYRWTSAGPNVTFSSGTTARIRVTLERRAPATFLIPGLRSWYQGADADDRE